MKVIKTLKFLALLFCLALLMNCEKEDDSVTLHLEINSLENNEMFINTESLYIDITSGITQNQVKNIAFYIDDILVEESTEQTFICKIELDEYSIGEHDVKVILRDKLGNEGSNTKKIHISQSIGESPNGVNFTEGIPDTWIIDSWDLNNNLGYEGSQSLQSTVEGGTIITTKTYEKEGCVNFRIKKNNGELIFYVDGEIKTKWFLEQDWNSYSYYVSEGTHTFKWKSISPNIILDDVKFVEDKIVHSIGEYFGGGIIFDLDSLNEHGLIASRNDLGNFAWGCVDTIFEETDFDFHDGETNTLKILSICDEENSAARLCTDFKVIENNITYDDWFLPAPMQLKRLYDNREILGSGPQDVYWASYPRSVYEWGIEVSTIILFSDGRFHGALRRDDFLIRPIRAF